MKGGEKYLDRYETGHTHTLRREESRGGVPVKVRGSWWRSCVCVCALTTGHAPCRMYDQLILFNANLFQCYFSDIYQEDDHAAKRASVSSFTLNVVGTLLKELGECRANPYAVRENLRLYLNEDEAESEIRPFFSWVDHVLIVDTTSRFLRRRQDFAPAESLPRLRRRFPGKFSYLLGSTHRDVKVLANGEALEGEENATQYARVIGEIEVDDLSSRDDPAKRMRSTVAAEARRTGAPLVISMLAAHDLVMQLDAIMEFRQLISNAPGGGADNKIVLTNLLTSYTRLAQFREWLHRVFSTTIEGEHTDIFFALEPSGDSIEFAFSGTDPIPSDETIARFVEEETRRAPLLAKRFVLGVNIKFGHQLRSLGGQGYSNLARTFLSRLERLSSSSSSPSNPSIASLIACVNAQRALEYWTPPPPPAPPPPQFWSCHACGAARRVEDRDFFELMGFKFCSSKCMQQFRKQREATSGDRGGERGEARRKRGAVEEGGELGSYELEM